MTLKKLVLLLGMGASGLVAATLLYAATTNPIQEINNELELSQALRVNKYAVVEFYSPTCPVCKAFATKGIFAESAQALPEVKFIMVSSLAGAELQKANGIKAWPTFIYYKDGKQVDHYEGYEDNPTFIHRITRTLDIATPNLKRKRSDDHLDYQPSKR